MNYDDNWVNIALDNAVRTVQSWPEWMRRPEIRMPGSSGANAYNSKHTDDDSVERVAGESD